MTYYYDRGIVRDGVESAYGRFTVNGIERTESAELKAMFLPKLSPQGRSFMRDKGADFVRSLLVHYGVELERSEVPQGQKVNYLKKMLLAGKVNMEINI